MSEYRILEHHGRFYIQRKQHVYPDSSFLAILELIRLRPPTMGYVTDNRFSSYQTIEMAKHILKSYIHTISQPDKIHEV